MVPATTNHQEKKILERKNQFPSRLSLLTDTFRTNTFQIRTKEGYDYVDDAWIPVSEDQGRPSARTVSRRLLEIGDNPWPVSSTNGLSLLSTYFGQFIAHDLVISPEPGQRNCVRFCFSPFSHVFF